MQVNAYSFPDKSVVDTDVCIVGAGPAGITLAREMNGAQFRVCLIESGGTAFDAATQELARMATADSDITPAYQNRRRQFGGNDNLWRVGRRPSRSLVRYLPLDAIDFAKRSLVPYSGWPFGREDLDPYYARAHHACGLGEYSYSVSCPGWSGVRDGHGPCVRPPGQRVVSENGPYVAHERPLIRP